MIDNNTFYFCIENNMGAKVVCKCGDTMAKTLAKHYLGMINKMVLLGSNYAESLA